MSDDFVKNLKEPSHWLRVFFMLGFAIVLYVAGIVLLAITVAQLLFSLLTGTDNRNLRALGASLATYVYEILKYLTYNSEVKPFPFAPFPFVEADPFVEAEEPDPTAFAAGPAPDPVVPDPVVAPAADTVVPVPPPTEEENPNKPDNRPDPV